MTVELENEEKPNAGFGNLLTKWLVAMPMFSSLMVLLTNEQFFGNSVWESLRATGNSAPK